MPKKVPNISQQQEIKRLDFCKQFNVPGFFDNVFLTDESTFQLHRNTINVWSSKNNSYPKKKLWSGVLCRKKDFSCISTKIMRMLTLNCTRTPLPTSYLMPTSFIQTVGFLNRTAHTAASTRDYLSGHGIQLLQSPPNSPDLWTIEIVWQIFKHEIEKKNPKNLDELRQYAWECRTILDLNTRKKLIDATYERFSKCVKNEGKLVKY